MQCAAAGVSPFTPRAVLSTDRLRHIGSLPVSQASAQGRADGDCDASSEEFNATQAAIALARQRRGGHQDASAKSCLGYLLVP